MSVLWYIGCCTIYTRKGENPTEFIKQTEGSIVKYASISNSEKFWEVIHASITLKGEAREEALAKVINLQVPVDPLPAA